MSNLVEIKEFVNDVKHGRIQDREIGKKQIENYLNGYRNQYNNLNDLVTVAPMLMEAYNLLN